MKVELLKNIIKEAVREVLREELNNVRTATHSQPVKNSPRLQEEVKQETLSQNPLENALLQTMKEFSRQDYNNLLDNSNQSILESLDNSREIPSGVGIDLNQLDFVKNAAAIFNQSNKKNF